MVLRTRTQKRLLSEGIALSALIVLLSAGGCSSKTFRNATRQHITRSNGSTPLRQSFNRLTHGMTEAEVVALMGPPARKKATEANGYQFMVYNYAEGDWRAVIGISPRHGLLVAHSSDDPDFGK